MANSLPFRYRNREHIYVSYMSVKTANCGVFLGIESLCVFRVSVAKRRLAVTFPSRIRFLLVACGEFFLQQAGLFFFFFCFFYGVKRGDLETEWGWKWKWERQYLSVLRAFSNESRVALQPQAAAAMEFCALITTCS